jgi:hypothetical protein
MIRESSACRLVDIVEPSQGNAFIDGITDGDVDRPAARFPELVAIRFPLFADAKANVRD